MKAKEFNGIIIKNAEGAEIGRLSNIEISDSEVRYILNTKYKVLKICLGLEEVTSNSEVTLNCEKHGEVFCYINKNGDAFCPECYNEKIAKSFNKNLKNGNQKGFVK